MSVLEHIRKRPAIVISILGLALVLFIITAVSDNFSSLFGDRTTAVKVDGTKLDINKLSAESRRISNQMRMNGQEDVDASYVNEVALQQIIDKQLRDRQFDNLDITVTDKEMEGYLFGPNSVGAGMAQQYGFNSPEEFYAAAYSNNVNADDIRALWENMENDLRDNIKAMKYQMMLGALTANKLDAKAYFDESKNVTLNVAKVDYATLANDDYAVTDAEINDRYNKEKENYKIDTERRIVDYIVVTPTPSKEDAAATSEAVVAAITALKETPGTEAVDTDYEFKTTKHVGSLDKLPANIKNVMPTLEEQTAIMLGFNGSTYSLAKLISKETGVESANVDFYITDGTVLPMADVTERIAAGEIAQSTDSIQKIAQPNLSLVKGQPFAEYAGKFINAGNGVNVVTDADEKVALLSALFGAVDPSMVEGVEFCYVVNSVEAPTDIYEVASITRELVPSDATINQMREELASYSAKNATAESLNKNIASTKFNIEKGYVSPDHYSVIDKNGRPIAKTVSLVRWALEDAQKGNVSDVADAGDSFVVIALEDIYNDYIPATDPTVKDALTAQIRAEKKGAKLVADYTGKGKSVDEYAAAMNTTPITIHANYANNSGERMGADAKFLGAVGAAEQGKLVGPVATDNATVVFEVVNVDNAAGEFDFQSFAPMVANMFRFNINQALRANKAIKYDALRFESKD